MATVVSSGVSEVVVSEEVDEVSLRVSPPSETVFVFIVLPTSAWPEASPVAIVVVPLEAPSSPAVVSSARVTLSGNNIPEIAMLNARKTLATFRHHCLTARLTEN